MILTRSTRITQAYGDTQVDLGSPFDAGLQDVYLLGGGGAIALVGEKTGQFGTLTPAVSQVGTATKFANAAIQSRPPSVYTGEVTVLSVAVPTTVDANNRSFAHRRNSSLNNAAGGGSIVWELSHSSTSGAAFTVWNNAGSGVSVATGAGSVVAGQPLCIAGVARGNGSNLEIYRGGVLAASASQTVAMCSAATPMEIGGRTANNNSRYFLGTQSLLVTWKRALSPRELESITANPWQLFRPVQRRVYFDMGAGGGAAHTVTADPVEQGSTTTRPGLTQTHVTTASAVAQGATVSRPAVTQTHVVTARAVAQGSTVNAPAVEVGSITVVTARPVVQSSTVNAPSIVQTHIVTARPSAQGGTVTRPGLDQTHTVTARAVTQSSVVNAPSVDVGSTPSTVVTARPVAQGNTVTRPGILQTHVTSARAVVQGSTINAPGLVQAHVVTARPVVQAGSVNKPWVTTGSGTFTGLSPADLAAIRAAVRSELSAELLRISEIAKLHGLVQGAPLVVTPTSRTAGDVAQTVNTAGATTTVTRQ